jgi:hypothetical protein
MSLAKAPVKTGGLCSIKYCKKEEVLTFPEINPETGLIESSLVLKPGGVLYYCAAIDQGRSFEEQHKSSTAGPYFEISVKGNLQGSSAANILSLQKMQHHQWVVIAEDRNGVTRLIGNQDSGADISHSYTTGTVTDSRKTEISFKWQHPLSAPIYTATAFTIIIGGIIITAGCITLLQRFEVGAPGAPMADGDTLLINNGFINKQLLIMADGTGIPIDDLTGAIDWTGSIQRHAEKALAANTINFKGGVREKEIIEIYAFN